MCETEVRDKEMKLVEKRNIKENKTGVDFTSSELMKKYKHRRHNRVAQAV